MTSQEKEQIRRDIAEAFSFARFLVENPKFLRKVKNGAEINILPSSSRGSPRFYHSPKNIQAFTAKTVFHPL